MNDKAHLKTTKTAVGIPSRPKRLALAVALGLIATTAFAGDDGSMLRSIPSVGNVSRRAMGNPRPRPRQQAEHRRAGQTGTDRQGLALQGFKR